MEEYGAKLNFRFNIRFFFTCNLMMIMYVFDFEQGKY